MTITRALAVGVGALLLAIAGISPTASATTEVPSGPYQQTDASGFSRWAFTPCGADCTVANFSTADGTAMNLTFHLSDGSWAASGPVDVPCPRDGSTATTTVNYDFDAETLAGEMESTLMVSSCGRFAGTTTAPASFRLTKIG